MSIPIPTSHVDLLTQPIHGVFTTMMPDGQPQSSLVWCGYDGECACVNTTRERHHKATSRPPPSPLPTAHANHATASAAPRRNRSADALTHDRG